MTAPALRSLRLSDARGLPLRFHLLLAPNLPATAPRDAIVARLDAVVERAAPVPADQLDRGRPYRLEPVDGALATLVETWCDGRLAGWLKLRRDQLRALLAIAADTDRVRWITTPAAPLADWRDGVPAAIAAALREPAPAPAPTPAATPKVRRAEEYPREPRRRTVIDGSPLYLAISLPDREDPGYDAILDLLKFEGFTLDPANRKWWLRDRHRVLVFLARHLDTLQERHGAITGPAWAQHLAPVLAAARPRASVSEAGSDSFEIEVSLEARGIDPAELARALAAGREYVEGNGRVALLGPKVVERLAAAQRAVSGDPRRTAAARVREKVRASAATDLARELEEAGVETSGAPAGWAAARLDADRLGALPPAPAPAALAALLRPYQALGAAWLWHLRGRGLGGVLADEMGLGKTVQAIAVLAAAHGTTGPAAARDPSLVVAPASLLENWRRELARFAPRLRTFVHHGTQRLAGPEDARSFDLVVTSFGTLARDEDLFAGIAWDTIVADEAQHLKNRRTQQARALRRPRARARFVLTGTPVENSLDDLRALFDFALPGHLARAPDGTRGDERAWFDARHRRQAAPFILRRSKALVAPELPERLEQRLACALGPAQRRLYERLRAEGQAAVDRLASSGAGEAAVRMAVFTQLLRLRQACAEPRVLDPEWDAGDSAKREAFLELLDEALDGGHRMLVFSSFTSVLDHLGADLAARDVPFVRLDGSMARAARQEAVDRFQGDDSIPVFLLSLKAGGTGLNLTGADTVVHFDPWWNPAAEAQATDRAHRIGQERTVTSIRLVAADTVEERILALQETKAALLASVLEESAEAQASLALDELRGLLASAG